LKSNLVEQDPELTSSSRHYIVRSVPIGLIHCSCRSIPDESAVHLLDDVADLLLVVALDAHRHPNVSASTIWKSPGKRKDKRDGGVEEWKQSGTRFSVPSQCSIRTSAPVVMERAAKV
jgi:hypothetical protein